MDWDEERALWLADMAFEERSWRQLEQHPPWRRVYRDGVDITDGPIEEWGWPFAPDGKDHGRKYRR